MTSFHTIGFPNLHISYQPAKSQLECSRLPGSNFTEGGEKHSAQDLQPLKKLKSYTELNGLTFPTSTYCTVTIIIITSATAKLKDR